MADQLILFALLLAVFIFLIWGRWRYDIVAFVALLVALLTGVVPAERAFSGFGHPASEDIMNNVAALALLMPVDIQAAAKAKRSPALSLMPLSFASILGGMITLIGWRLLPQGRQEADANKRYRVYFPRTRHLFLKTYPVPIPERAVCP